MVLRRWTAVFLLLALALSVSGCCGVGCGTLPRIRWRLPGLPARFLRGSGNLVSKEMDYADFGRLDISHSFKVRLTQSDQYRVTITADDNLWDAIEVSTARDTLRVGIESGNYSLDRVTFQAEVSMPVLEGVVLSGASSLSGDMDTDDLNLEVSGASSVRLSGSGRDVRMNVSGASQADLSDFVVENAVVELSGATSATVNVTGRMDAEASGASHLYYLGAPTMGKINTSGASTIRQK